MAKIWTRYTLIGAVVAGAIVPVEAQEARRRSEMQCMIRQDKFDLVLPAAMRENHIDVWIVMQKEGHYDPLYDDLGRGYTGSIGYYVFRDPGEGRVERLALGTDGYMLEACGVYDHVGDADELEGLIETWQPQRIGLNMSHEIGGADGLSYTGYQHLVEILGEPWVSRFVSAERLVSDFRSRRVAAEIVAFGEAGNLSRSIAERALSNEIITPGVTRLEDVAFWMLDQLLVQGLGSSFDMPSVYITGPNGIEATSNERVIQRGDTLMIDWGVCLMNMCTDVKRIAYVLQDDETGLPEGIQNAFDQGVRVREILRNGIKVGRTAGETLDLLNEKIDATPGFLVMETFDKPVEGPHTDVIIGCHSVGNLGHGVGPSIAAFNPKRLSFEIETSNLFSIELFAYTAVPEWGGAKLRIPLEDDAIVTERGIEWLYPINRRILLIG